ncbi:Hypothetical protein D9617_51g089060 [Elsinoe fawcettii]|nr:Hypothetical protein D9617_51g089060 [Elsinoe fawcettii]
MSSLGTPVRMEYIPRLAYIIAGTRPLKDRPRKQSGKDWVKAFEKRHAELSAKRVKAMDWNRHDRRIYKKVAHCFEVIGAVLNDPAVLAENVSNMDETGVMLSKLGTVKVLPYDIAIFATLRSAYRDNVERMERGGVRTIGKQHFTLLFNSARETSFTERNMLQGWSEGGLSPFNP